MDNKSVDTRSAEAFLDQLYEIWQPVRQDTIAGLGRDAALRIVDLHANNWLDIRSWVSDAYTAAEQVNMVFAEFHRVFKEIYWIQFLFLNGNYPAVYRSLRHILEMMAQAYHIDMEFQTLTMDEKIRKMIDIENARTKREFGWQIVKPVLSEIFQLRAGEVDKRFGPVWHGLNRHAHPSAKQLDKVVSLDPSSLVRDSFDKTLASDTLDEIDVVMDLVYAIIFSAFQKINKLALGHGIPDRWEKYLPNTVQIIKAGG